MLFNNKMFLHTIIVKFKVLKKMFCISNNHYPISKVNKLTIEEFANNV